MAAGDRKRMPLTRTHRVGPAVPGNAPPPAVRHALTAEPKIIPNRMPQKGPE